MNINFQKSRHIWQKKRFNMDRLSFVWQKSFIQSLEIFYMIDNFNQNLKTSNTMFKHPKAIQTYTRIGFSQFYTFKKNFLFKISTIRTKKSTDIRSLVSPGGIAPFLGGSIAKRCPRSAFNTQKL